MGHLLTLTNQDARFYPLLGPFLSRREIVAELGAPVWDDDGKRWYVALDDADGVIGFAAVTEQRGAAHLGSAYVVPTARSNGVYSDLLAARLADYRGQCLTVTANAHTAPAYESAGFVVDRRTKSFWFLHREAGHA